MDTTIDPTTGNDLGAQNLAKAIRQRESGGNYNAVGDAGTSHGGYQFQQGTWKQYAKEVLGDENAEMTPANQNAVAYGKIKKWKDEGKDAAQIAAMWNAGEGIGDKWVSHKGKTVINGKTISYDTPQYVKDVTDLYQQYKGQAPQTATNQPQPKENKFLKGANELFKDIEQPFVSLAALPTQGLAKALGQPDPYKDFAEQTKLAPVTSTDQPFKDVARQELGNAAQVASYALPEAKLPSILAAGALQSGGAALSSGADNKQALKEAERGALFSGILHGGNKVLSHLAKNLPRSMIQGKFEGLTDEQANKFLKQKIGTKESLLNQAEKVVQTEGKKIDDILKSKPIVFTQNPLIETLDQFPEYKNKVPKLVDKIKSFVSHSSNIGEDRKTILGYIDKIVSNSATPFEKNQVRKVLDRATKGGYAKLAKSIAPSAGHDLVMTFADALRNDVKKLAPETVPLFDELQKSVNIKQAVNKVVNKKSSGDIFSYNDIIPFMGGSELLPGSETFGGVAGVVGNRISRNPASRFAVAKLTKGALEKTNKATTVAKRFIPGILTKETNPKESQK